MSKISQLYDMLNGNLTKFGIFHEMLSIDESMVPYFGRHSAKMFARGKFIRFGYKIWCMCGYPYHMKIYQGTKSPESITWDTHNYGDGLYTDCQFRCSVPSALF